MYKAIVQSTVLRHYIRLVDTCPPGAIGPLTAGCIYWVVCAWLLVLLIDWLAFRDEKTYIQTDRYI